MFKKLFAASCFLAAACCSFADPSHLVVPAVPTEPSTSDEILPPSDSTSGKEIGSRAETNDLRDLQFENDRVRVWKSTIKIDQPVQMHRHNAPKVIVALQGGLLHRIEQTGAVSNILFDTGKAYWLDADPPNEFHADINPSSEPIEVMVIELRR